MKNLSIGSRLTVWYVLMFAGGQLVFGLGMWFTLHHKLYDIADDQLEAQIDDLQHLLRSQSPDATVSSFREALAAAYRGEHPGDYLQVKEETGAWIYRAEILEKHDSSVPSPAELRLPLYENLTLEGHPYRFLSEVLVANGHRFVVQTGVEDDDVLHTLGAFRNGLLVFAILTLLVASAVGYWLSRQALAPVDAITRTARSITGSNLSSRLATLDTDDELKRLSDTLNEMLGRIEASFQRISQFTADASHELRTPISLIRTEAEIALRKSRDEREYQESLSHILKEAERTSALIENLLALARADAGHFVLEMQILNLSETVMAAAKEWQRVMADRDLTFIHQVTGEVWVSYNEGALRRLLNILLDNAMKYTPAGGKVTLSLEQNGSAVKISVSDTGVGIAAEDKAHIFERFYRADKARHRESAGAGLGLAIAEWIVQQHKGTIGVESVPGRGTTATVNLATAQKGADSLPSEPAREWAVPARNS